MAKILAIQASPRKNGNSDRLLESFIKGAEEAGHEVEKIHIASLKISPCDAAGGCHKTGLCRRYKDDMQPLYGKLVEADHIVISSPTFFMGVPAQLKAMIDRCQALWAKRFLLKMPLRKTDKKRYGFFLGTSGLNKKEAFMGSRETIKALFYVLGLKYGGEVLAEGIDKKGDIEKRQDALDEAHNMAKNIS